MLWLTGSDWDGTFPPEIIQEWTTYRKQLPSIEQLQIFRWIGTDFDTQSIQLHCFAGASMRASAVYFSMNE